MAKKDQKLTLSDLTQGLQQGKLAMNPAIQAQLEAAMSAPAEQSTPVSAANVSTSKTDSNISKLNSNIVRLIRAIEENTKVLDAKSRVTKGYTPTSANDLSEKDIETQKSVDYQTHLLEQIEENTREPKKSAGKDQADKDQPAFKIGGWLTAIAVALGITAGIFLGQFKAFMTVMKLTGKAIAGIGRFIKNLIPESLKSGVMKSIKSIRTFFSDIVTKMMINLEYAGNMVKQFFRNRFGKFFAKIESAVGTFSEFFSKAFAKVSTGASKVGSTFRSISALISKFFAPIGEAWKVIKTTSSTVGGVVDKVLGFFRSIAKFFGNIVGKLGALTKVFGAVTKIVSKIAYPITIIMGLYDAIMGAIDGFEEGGLVGGIKGFVKGAWNSIVSSFLDLIKDLISWVLGAFGFKDAEKWLDSWSFEDLFDKFWDMLFKPFEWIQDFFTNLEIPKFDFSIFGKKFEFGPYKIGGGGDAKAKTTTAPKAATPVAAANKVYNQSAENKEADKKVTQPKSNTVITAPTQVNNQTQNAFIKTPIRNNDNTINKYLAMNF